MDRRVRKTREAVYTAFIALVAQRGYDKLSVQDIIDEADVGRTTFYAHFRTKEDLFRYGFHRLREGLAEVLEKEEGEGDGWAFLEPLLMHARTHAGLFKALVGGGGDKLAEAEFRRVVEEMVGAAVGEKPASLKVTMVVGALLSGIRHWLDDGAGKAGEAALRSSARAIGASMEQTK